MSCRAFFFYGNWQLWQAQVGSYKLGVAEGGRNLKEGEKVLREAHIRRLEEKYGIPAEKARELAEAGYLASVSREEAAQLLGLPPDKLESGGILVRYPSADAVTVRLDIPYRGQGKERKYMRPAGQANRLYVPPSVRLDEVVEIWLTEGEMKALAASLHGLPVVAIAGIWNWRTDRSEDDPAAAAFKMAGGGETSGIPDDLALLPDLNRSWDGKTWVLWYDSDITQSHVAWPAFAGLAEQLYRLGAGSVKILNVPALKNGEKTGMDDYILARELEGKDPVAELRALAAAAPEWLPTAAGARAYAEKRLRSANLEEVARGAAALLAVTRLEAAVEEALKEAGIKKEYRRSIVKRAKEVLRDALKYQRAQCQQSAGLKVVGDMLADAPAEALGLFVPEGWVLKEDGVYRVDLESGAAEQVTAAPVVVAAFKTDVDSALERYVELAVRSPVTGEWQRYVLEAAAIYDTTKAVRSLREGANVPGVSSVTAKHIVEYLTEFEKLNVQNVRRDLVTYSCGFKSSLPRVGEAFVSGKRIITRDGVAEATGAAGGAERDKELLEFLALSPGEQQLAEALSARKGTLDGWVAEVLRPVAHLDAPRLAVYLALAPPVMRFTNVPNFIVDFSGLPGTGKTLTARIAASCWGDPSDEGLVLGWDSTKVGLERVAAFFRNVLIVRDDTSRARRKEDVGHFVYEFCGGRERGRGAPEGLRAAGTWQSVMISTGEEPLYSFLSTGQGGARRRTVEFTQPCIPSPKLQKHVAYALKRHYGHAAEVFVRYLLNLPNEDREALAAEAARLDTDVFLPLLEREGVAVDSFTASYSAYFALLALTASLAHDALPLPWTVEEGRETLERVFLDACWRAEAQYAHVLAFDYVRSWVAANACHFYGHPDHSPGRNGHEVFGKWEEGRYVAVYPHRLRCVLSSLGVSLEGTLERWADAGWIDWEGSSKRRYDIKTLMGSIRPRLVRIRWDALFSTEADGNEAGSKEL